MAIRPHKLVNSRYSCKVKPSSFGLWHTQVLQNVALIEKFTMYAKQGKIMEIMVEKPLTSSS